VCVDAEPAALESLAGLLEQRFGEIYDVRCFSSADECLRGLAALAKEGRPVPLVLCDVELPHLAAQVDQRPDQPAMVVLIQKPWKGESLVASIESLLAGEEASGHVVAHQRAVERQNASLEALHQIGVALASSFDIDSILRQIARAAVSLLGKVPVDVFYAGCRTINAQARWLPSSPTPAHLSSENRLKLEREVAALADETAGEDSSGRAASEIRLPDRQVIPIAQQDSLLGLIVLGPRRPLSEEDRGLLSILGLQAATAFHNIHLTQERIHFERLSAVGRMIGSVVHDFRSPLTAVRGYAGMLASLAVSDDDRHEYARLIVEECDRLGGLTDELLELTRGSRSKPVLRRIGLGDFFRELRPSLEAQFMDSGVRLDVELDYQGPACLDADRMTRAILNVAANARQAIDGDGSFAVRSKQDSENVILEFEDTGCGIPEEIRHRIFEPFFSYGKAQGIGLGMCIIQRIVHEHGGETALSSEPGVGTTVRFLLPLEADHLPESSEAMETIQQPTAEVARGRRS
jgi:signal transduction histidine kinase